MTLDNETKQPRTATAQSRELGAELKAARRSAGLKGSQVAAELGWSTAKLSKLEKGWRGTSEWDIAALLGRCGTGKPDRDRIMHLARERHLGRFVRPHQPGFPDGVLCLTIHERTAATITCYEPTIVPALVQAETYASALLSTVVDSSDALCSMVRQRMDRRTVLDGAQAPESVFYLHETALDLLVGGVGTMHDQITWLTFVSDWARVTVRVIPMTAGGHSAVRRPVTLLTFAQNAAPLAYADMDASTVFEDDPEAIESHRRTFAALDSMALDVEESRAMLRQRADNYDHISIPSKENS